MDIFRITVLKSHYYYTRISKIKKQKKVQICQTFIENVGYIFLPHHCALLSEEAK